MSFDDFPLDNELVSKNEKAFVEEATTELPLIVEEKSESAGPLVLPIDEHKEEILRTVQTQRVTIIHGETGCGKSTRVPCFLLRVDPPEPTVAAPEVKIIISQPRRIAAKALAERVRSCEPDLADKIGLRSKFSLVVGITLVTLTSLVLLHRHLNTSQWATVLGSTKHRRPVLGS
jgi:HrpA-like RNA helicase